MSINRGMDKDKYTMEYSKVKVLAAQLCLNLCDTMDCSPPGCSVHGILQARILEWVAILPADISQATMYKLSSVFTEEKTFSTSEFPGAPVVRTRHFHCLGLGSRPASASKIKIFDLKFLGLVKQAFKCDSQLGQC